MDKIVTLVDGVAFQRNMTAHTAEYGGSATEGNVAVAVAATWAVRRKVCAWMSGADHYAFLRTRESNGRLVVVMRRTTGFGVSYHEVEITRSSDGVVRAADVYSYFTGEWISEELARLLVAAGDGPSGMTVGVGIGRITMLEDQQPEAALAAFDELPPKVRELRAMQGWRVKLSQHISMSAYAAALEELFRRFPNDPSVALHQVDGAFLRGDISGALHFIDLVDAQVGPDPMLDATRAMLLASRNAPGDVELAAGKAEHAVMAVPELPAGYMARAFVSAAGRNWGKALDQLADLSSRFGLPIDDAALRTTPVFAELLQTPEYASWRAMHP